ncbi:MAG: DUF4340 domain-containing protein [Chitinophagales bacterium]|nr:DUF4340 domain-containing protein [Chitinophagales bacterium]
MSKFSNKSLLLLLVALGAILGAIKYFDSQKGERNFRNELVEIDSAKVSTILIYPKSKKGEEVKLFKEGSGWKVKITDSKSQQVDSARITGLFEAIAGLKPTRLAARGSDKWKEFEVDTSGSRLVVKEGDKTTLDILIGKFNFSGGREVETLVRLSGEDETYAVNGFLDGTFNTGIDSYRNKTIVKGNKDNFTKLTFALSDTMRYSLEKRDSVWFVDGATSANTTELENYLSTISALNATSFIDDVDASGLSTPSHTLQIDDTQGNKINVEGFIQNNRKIIRSSQNADNLLNGEGVWEKVFADKFTFLPADTLTFTK